MYLKDFLFFFGFSLLLSGCAGVKNTEDSFSDAPCTECGEERGNLELEISDKKTYREWNPSVFNQLDSAAVVGVFPALKVEAVASEDCKICHSFSASALDFDLAQVEDSVFKKQLPQMKRFLMVPGVQIPEADSSEMEQFLKDLAKEIFVDEKPLASLEPWMEREGFEQVISRTLPYSLQDKLSFLATSYKVRYISLPVFLQVHLFPNEGKNGAYSFKILYLFFDARYRKLGFLSYSEFYAKTTGKVSAEKDFAKPFAKDLYEMLSTDISEIENH